MRCMRSNRRRMMTVKFFFLLCVLVVAFVHASLDGWAQGTTGETESVELTKTDLFSLPGWERSMIAVNGFTLGITRTDAFRIAEAANMRLVPRSVETARKRRGPCLQDSCAVYGENWVGIDLYFDATQHVNKIAVGTSVDEYPEVKRASVIRLFKGRTAQFFNDYTDGLREQLLGHVEGKVTHDIISGKQDSHFAYIEYDYLHSGIIVHVTLATGDPKPLDLQVDFVARQ
jgi:hypothetical protein